MGGENLLEKAEEQQRLLEVRMRMVMWRRMLLRVTLLQVIKAELEESCEKEERMRERLAEKEQERWTSRRSRGWEGRHGGMGAGW